jgi:hypothetical protein
MRYTRNCRQILLMMNNFPQIDVTAVAMVWPNGSRFSSRQGWAARALH